jgi:Tfp pilus assembly protein PilN
MHGFWQSANLGGQLAEETQRVEEASLGLQKLEAENKKFNATLQQIEMALALEGERLRWPRLLEELKKHSTKGLWITGLKVMPGGGSESGAAGPGKPVAPSAATVEIEGMFETRSEKADAEGVANFQKALEAGGVLTQVAVLERETPQYVDGKTDQVALKFRLKADWPLLIPEKAPAAGGSK